MNRGVAALRQFLDHGARERQILAAIEERRSALAFPAGGFQLQNCSSASRTASGSRRILDSSLPFSLSRRRYWRSFLRLPLDIACSK
jgi:hypothetical protein